MKKTALVTGGSGGIGSEICRALAEDGWQVAVCYKNGRAAAEALVSELKERGLCAEAFYCDIGDKDSIDKCVAEVRDSLGFVTLLVNNAGTADIELFTDMTDEKLCEMMNVNLLGAMRMSRAVDMDIYNIDGVMYTLDIESKTYYTVDMEESIDDFKSEIGYGINDSYKFISSETTDDGLICETFESTEDPDMELESGVTLDTSDSDDYSFTTTFKYYFNADTKDIVKIETISDGSTTTVTINSFTTENVEVKLPDDFDSWTEQSFDKDTEDIPYDAELDVESGAESAE